MKQMLLIIILFIGAGKLNAQCSEDSRAQEMLKKRNDIGFSDNTVYSAYESCRRYYVLLCAAELDYYMEDGVKKPRTEQQARMIEDGLNKIVDDYNYTGVKKCGEIQKVKAVFSSKIEERKENVVGYWITEEISYGESYYPELYFGNDNDFHVSYYNPKNEKSSWRKTGENAYEVDYKRYDTYDKKWNDPEIRTFQIDPSNCTGTYSFIDSEGNNGSSIWVFKGTAFNMYGFSKEEKLKPENCSTSVK